MVNELGCQVGSQGWLNFDLTLVYSLYGIQSNLNSLYKGSVIDSHLYRLYSGLTYKVLYPIFSHFGRIYRFLTVSTWDSQVLEHILESLSQIWPTSYGPYHIWAIWYGPYKTVDLIHLYSFVSARAAFRGLTLVKHTVKLQWLYICYSSVFYILNLLVIPYFNLQVKLFIYALLDFIFNI